MRHAHDAIHKELMIRLHALRERGVATEAIDAYLAQWEDSQKSREVTDALLAALEKADSSEEAEFVLKNREYLAKKSIWAFGGDGWAYDIGFGGIDHD